jgi:hypothetical protein
LPPIPVIDCSPQWFSIFLLHHLLFWSPKQHSNFVSSALPLIVSLLRSYCLFKVMPVIVTRCSLSQLALIIIHSFIIHSIHKHLFRAYSLSKWC